MSGILADNTRLQNSTTFAHSSLLLGIPSWPAKRASLRAENPFLKDVRALDDPDGLDEEERWKNRMGMGHFGWTVGNERRGPSTETMEPRGSEAGAAGVEVSPATGVDADDEGAGRDVFHRFNASSAASDPP